MLGFRTCRPLAPFSLSCMCTQAGLHLDTRTPSHTWSAFTLFHRTLSVSVCLSARPLLKTPFTLSLSLSLSLSSQRESRVHFVSFLPPLSHVCLPPLGAMVYLFCLERGRMVKADSRESGGRADRQRRPWPVPPLQKVDGRFRGRFALQLGAKFLSSALLSRDFRIELSCEDRDVCIVEF